MVAPRDVRFNFAGKTVLITGGTSGIGLQTGIDFAEAGANVVVAGRSDERIDAARTRLEGTSAIAVKADVAVADQVRALVDDTVERFGRLDVSTSRRRDVAISNAAVYIPGDITDINLSDWNALRATNIDGLFHLAQAALPHLEKVGGSFLATSSASGIRGDWGASIYDASKGAVSLFVKALALDWGGRGVRVNAVAPSVTDTPAVEGITGSPELKALFEERVPLGRLADPADISPAFLFLASDVARYINGVILPVDGGTSASNGQARPPRS